MVYRVPLVLHRHGRNFFLFDAVLVHVTPHLQGEYPEKPESTSFNVKPALSNAILVASKLSSFPVSSIRLRKRVIPAPTIATRRFILVPTTLSSLLERRLRQILWVFRASSVLELSLPSESVIVPPRRAVAALPQASCANPSPRSSVQLPMSHRKD